MAYSIYAHQSPSGKVYIGQTKQNPTRRWGAGHGYRCCGAFKNAIDKYGWDNISHSILFENLEEDEANKLEKLLISIFRSVDRNYGYNILEGGGNGDMPQEVKDKISKANKGVKKPLLFREKISKARTGKKGHPCSQKTKDVARELHSRKVVCVETGEVFPSILVAGETKNCDASSIAKVCKGINITCGGFHWRYEEDTNYVPKERQPLGNHKKSVVCIETNTIYESISSASNDTGIGRTSINNALSGYSRSAGGYTWKYAERGRFY